MRVGAVSGMPLLAPESFGVMHKAQVRLEAGESSIEIDSVQFCTSVRLVTISISIAISISISK
jgi:hypothetical protein